MQNIRCARGGNQPRAMVCCERQNPPCARTEVCEERSTREYCPAMGGEIDCLENVTSLAMVYSPCQTFTDLFELDEALNRGTIFRALNMPFKPGYGRRGECG